MRRYRISEEILSGEMTPTFFLDVEVDSGWKNIVSSKNRDYVVSVLHTIRANEVKEMENEKFFMVIRKSGNSAPSVRHTDRDKAVFEAQRLASQSNESYYLLEAVGVIEPVKTPVKYRSI